MPGTVRYCSGRCFCWSRGYQKRQNTLSGMRVLVAPTTRIMRLPSRWSKYAENTRNLNLKQEETFDIEEARGAQATPTGGLA